MKLLRTIQLDASDSFVFDRAAASGEWAVSGAFAFLNRDIPALPGKTRAVAFAASLCDHPAGVIVAVTRSVEGGSIREAFRSLRPAAQSPARAFNFVEVVGGEQDPDEHLDLATLREGTRP